MFIIVSLILMIIGVTSEVGIAFLMGLFAFACGIGEICFYKSIYDNNHKKPNIQSKTLNQYETKETDKSSLFEQPLEDNLNIFSKISTRYKLHIELNFEIIELIYSYVEKTCSKYELENFVNIDREKLYNLFIENCYEEISKMKTIAQVQNRHFGLMGITLICCILISDDAYNSIKSEVSLWEHVKTAFVEKIDDSLKNDFYKVMDKCYLNWHLNQLMENKTIEELTNALEFKEHLTASVIAFAEKYSFTLNENNNITDEEKQEIFIDFYKKIKNASTSEDLLNDWVDKTFNSVSNNKNKLSFLIFEMLDMTLVVTANHCKNQKTDFIWQNQYTVLDFIIYSYYHQRFLFMKFKDDDFFKMFDTEYINMIKSISYKYLCISGEELEQIIDTRFDKYESLLDKNDIHTLTNYLLTFITNSSKETPLLDTKQLTIFPVDYVLDKTVTIQSVIDTILDINNKLVNVIYIEYLTCKNMKNK